MRIRVQKAIAEVNNNGWAKDLQGCPTLEERYQKLRELLPEVSAWFAIAKNQLFYYLQRIFSIDLGACEFYRVDDDDHRQYCVHGGGEEECNCMIPQLSCVIRDKGSKER